MIEITLALLIVAIGFISIMGMLPIGTTTFNDAVTNNISTNSADTLLHYFEDLAQQSWSSIYSLPTEPTDISSSGQDLDTNLAKISIDNTTDWKQFDASDFPNLYYWQSNTSGVYRIFEQVLTDTSSTNQARKYRTDFDGMVRIWRENVMIYDYATSSTDNNVDQRMKLNFEISWPITAPFAERKKQYYSLVIYRHED
ncbi:MAG: hypothetical protein MJH11_11010 [Lentisphaeria bacterium]|nr:hypothetical protein [Lentisphaeria bacterium]